MKDVFPRYKSMRGFDVPRKAGWDTHGLPVEIEVEKELRISGKDAIEAYGVEPFVRRCLESVFRYTEEWTEFTEKLGFWVDLDDAYVTYHQSYVESVWWALSELHARGLLYRGYKVVWWWAQGGTVLSAAEVGEGYKTVDDPSVYVRFPLRDDPGTSLLVWTTTPWTLPSNSLAAVKADVDYAVVRDGEQRLIVADALRETLAEKAGRDLPVERRLPGADLVGRAYTPPFDWFSRTRGDLPYWRVVEADFVELDAGTGVVHIAPAFGEVDFELLRREQERHPDLPLLCAVRPDGGFDPAVADAAYAGRWVKDCDRELTRELRERGLLWHTEQIRHEYPFCVRSENDALIQYARPAWYVRTTAHVADALANNDRIQLAARAHQGGALRRLPAQQRRLGAVARALLGHAAQHLGQRRDRRHGRTGLGGRDPRAQPARVRRIRRGARARLFALAPPARSQAVDRRRHLDAGGRARGLPPRARGHRRMVRLGLDALRPVGLPAHRHRGVRGGVSGGLHLRGDRPDPRLVQLAAVGVDPALPRARASPPLQDLRRPRARRRPGRQEGIEEQGQLHPARDHPRPRSAGVRRGRGRRRSSRIRLRDRRPRGLRGPRPARRAREGARLPRRRPVTRP